MQTNDTSEATKSAMPKRPYERPSFRFEQVFVTTALSCGKVNPAVQGSCTGSTKS